MRTISISKFVQAIQSANVLTIATGFAAEALRVGTIFNGQLTFFENHVAIDIGDGDFCGRDEVKIVEGAVIHLTFLVGQLTGAVSRCFVDYGGGMISR